MLSRLGQISYKEAKEIFDDRCIELAAEGYELFFVCGRFFHYQKGNTQIILLYPEKNEIPND